MTIRPNVVALLLAASFGYGGFAAAEEAVEHPPAFAPGQVFIPRGNSMLTGEVLKAAGLERLRCMQHGDGCLYRYASNCGEPRQAAERLTADLYACPPTPVPGHSPAGPKSPWRVFPNVQLLPKQIVSSAELLQPGTTPDQFYADQTALRAMGSDVAWQAPENLPTTPVLTAIIDNGADLNHPDLAPRLVDGIEIPCRTQLCNADSSRSYHGTAMAGIVAAERHNGGVIGTAWNTRILPIKISSSDEATYESSAVEAIYFAIANGARVMNFSYTAKEPTDAIRDALESSQADFLFVVPSGDDDESGNGTLYPAAHDLDNMIVVMDHDHDGARAGTHARDEIDIAAPGQAVHPVPCESAIPNDCYDPSPGSVSNATAYVSGAAALLWSVYPDWSGAQIRQRILDTADYEPKLGNWMRHPIRLNLARMMFPLWLDGAQGDSVTRTNLDSIRSQGAFPATMCSDVKTSVAPVDSHDATKSAASLTAGTRVHVVASCTRKGGGTSTARSRAYLLKD